jgi:Tfp pilus assembly protein PilF
MLASTWLQLGRTKEACSVLNKYTKYDSKDPIINFYLATLFFQRFDYINAWKYLKNSEKLLEKESHSLKILTEFKDTLAKTCLK